MSESIAKPSLFLKTKLLPPRAVMDFIPRPRLTQKLEAHLLTPITMIAADAGCGKTSLISEFLRSREEEYVWYQLDHTDADPFAFMGYLTEGISSLKKDFGQTVFSFLNDSPDEFQKNPERAVDLLLNEIFDHFDQPFIIVLDDYHHIGQETKVHQLVDRLLQYSADLLHIIMTTRDLPPLAMARHRSRSSALVIDRDDLLFTDDEVKELFKETLDLDLDDQEVLVYRERTNGWVTALQLVRQAAEQQGFSNGQQIALNPREVLDRSEKDIFDYFAEEVFFREDDQIKEALLYLSLLNSMPLELCSRVFPEKRVAAILPKLLQKNVFVTLVGNGEEVEEYRMHPLFREFLLRRLRTEIGREAIVLERKRIADYFLDNNNWRQAIPYLLEAELFQKAAEVIADKGEEWLNEGKIMTFNLYAEEIPFEVLEQFPRSLLHLAEAKRQQGDFEQSTKILNSAVVALGINKDKTGEAEAHSSLASLARRLGKIEDAFVELEKAEKLVSEESETFMKCSNTRGLCYAALGDWSQSEHHFHLALSLAEKFSNDRFTRIAAHNLAIPTGFRGEFSKALSWLRRMFRDESSPLPQEAHGYLNVGRMHLYRGEFEDALVSLKKSLELCLKFNMKPIKGEVLEALGHYNRDTGDYQKAVEYFESSRKAYDVAGINRFRHEVEEEFAIYYRMRGDFVKARALLENLLNERKKIEYEFGIKRVELGLAYIDLILGETEGLVDKLKNLLKFHREQNFNFEEAQNALLLSRACAAVKQGPDSIKYLKRALDLTARFDYEYWLKTEVLASRQFFNDPDISQLLPPDLRDLGATTEAATPLVTKKAEIAPLCDLSVNLFGGFEAFRDKNTPFANDAWTTKRARDIFACIVANKNHKVEKDILIDTFWAEDEFEAIEKNFHPTISHIRKALNSNQPFKQNFIVYRDGAYQLNPDFTYSIDVELFELALRGSEKAKKENDSDTFCRLAEEACELYGGEFMSGVYDPWVDEHRNYYAEQYGRLVGKLAEIAFEDKDWQQVRDRACEMLKQDPYREDMHCLIMKSYGFEGNAAGVKKQFSTLEKTLSDELGVEPADETIRVYKDLVSK